MSYIENLGRVKGDKGDKGDKGTVYIPRLKVENGRRYITWGEAVDGLTTPPVDVDITPQIYLPQLNEGYISFILKDAIIDDNAIPSSTIPQYIKGDTGAPGAIDIVIVDDDIDYENMEAYKEKGKIYLQNGIAKVYDDNQFYEINNLAKFNNYYTIDEINEKFGSIESCQRAILDTLDKNKDENINENTDEDTDGDNINTESGD